MARSLEEDLTEFLLGMHHRGTLTKSYYLACLTFWSELYGEKVAAKVRVRVKVKAGWGK